MKKLALAALAGLAVAAAVVGSGAAHPPKPSKDVVGHVYVNDNTAATNTVAGFDRHADGSLTPIPGSPFAVGGAGTGRARPRRARSSSATTAATCSRSTRAATRSRCSGSSPTARSRSREGLAGLLGRRQPGQHRRQRQARLRREPGPGQRPRATRTTPASRSTRAATSKPIAGSTLALPNDSRARPRPLQRRRQQARRHPHRQLGDRQLHRRQRRAPDPGARARRSPPRPSRPPQGYGQLGSEFSPTNPDQLFVSDAHTAAGGAAPGPRLQLHRRRERRPHADRPLAGRQRRHGVLLGRDQPRRRVPVRRQHRLDDRLHLLDRGRRLDHLPAEHARRSARRRRRGRPALARRLDALGRPGGSRRRHRLLGQRRHAHPALHGGRPGRRNADRDRRPPSGAPTLGRRSVRARLPTRPTGDGAAAAGRPRDELHRSSAADWSSTTRDRRGAADADGPTCPPHPRGRRQGIADQDEDAHGAAERTALRRRSCRRPSSTRRPRPGRTACLGWRPSRPAPPPPTSLDGRNGR